MATNHGGHAGHILMIGDRKAGHVCFGDLARDGARVQRSVQHLLKERFKVDFSTVQVEETCLEDEQGAEAIDFTRSKPPQKGSHPEAHMDHRR